MSAVRSRRSPAAVGLLIAAMAAGASAAAPAPDTVVVPGGPAAVRRLLGIDPARGDATFLSDVNTALLFATGDKASWQDVESRRKLAHHLEEVEAWRAAFGEDAVFTTGTKEAFARTRRALSWLGFQVKGEKAPFTAEARGDAEAVRRQGFLDLFGVSADALVK